MKGNSASDYSYASDDLLLSGRIAVLSGRMQVHGGCFFTTDMNHFAGRKKRPGPHVTKVPSSGTDTVHYLQGVRFSLRHGARYYL